MTRSPVSSITPVRLAVVLLATSLAGCSTITGWFSSDKVDYRTQARQIEGLQVPPDLSQLDNHSMTQDGTISASSYEQQQQQRRAVGDAAAPGAKPAPNSPAAAAANRVALSSVGNLSLERDGDVRWIHTDAAPEQLWGKVVAFWTDAGFEIDSAKPEIGLIQTKWHEDRSKIQHDILRDTIGKVFDGAYSTGQKEQFRTRVERSAKGGTDIFVSAYGIEEVYTSSGRDNTTWQPRAKDPLLEATMLSKLMLQLGGQTDGAALAAAAPAAAAASGAEAVAAAKPALPPQAAAEPRKPRALSEVPNQLEITDGFERAWRRVGQALDRHGFTIEDRDRTQGLFYLRYADPNQVGKEEPNFFQRLFGAKEVVANRYRVAVRSNGEHTTVLVLDNNGRQTTDDDAKRILGLLMDDLR